MTDYISRQAAIDAVERAKTARSADGEIFCAKINAQMNIQRLPSIQPEIVYCRDCKQFRRKGEDYGCCLEGYGNVDGNHYCSYGERKSDDDVI